MWTAERMRCVKPEGLVKRGSREMYMELWW